MPPEPVSGLYERLVTVELKRLLGALEPIRVDIGSPDAADAHVAVAEHLRRIIERALRAVPEAERLTRQAELCNAVLVWLEKEGQAAESPPLREDLVVPLEVLREVRALGRGAAFSQATPYPLVPLSSADLLVNARGEPSVGMAIEREIHSADRIDLLCAFVRWNGLRIIRPALEAHRDAGRPLRVITTVYTGSTERRALDWLASIGAHVRVSYDTRTTRLHAKAWLFERLSGYSTAFIGSSNLTHSAMLDGVEWNVRLAQASTPDLIEKFKAAFESYWADPSYEPYDPARDADRFDRAVRATSVTEATPIFHFDLQPWPFQREMLQRLDAERERHHRYRNLVVAATHDREAALRDLRDGTVNVVFCVDLFNEGVDIPEIDTVLFLRPTESALVFLQQLGRGLRRTDTKSCLTVLDFIGGASRRFRFDLRFRALLGGHRSDIIRQIEEGFPRLPSGCSIQLDRVASGIVLGNVKGSLGSSFAGLVAELRAMADARRHAGGDPDAIGLADFLQDAALELHDLYKSSGWTWSRLRREAGLPAAAEGPDEARVARAISRLLHVDDPNRLALYKRAVAGDLSDKDFDPSSSPGRALMGLHFSIWGIDPTITSLRGSIDRLRQHPALAMELGELFDVLDDQADHVPELLDEQMRWPHRVPLAVHSRASLDEIMAAFGRMTFDRLNRLRQGVDFDNATSSDLFFVTLEKAEDHYSPSPAPLLARRERGHARSVFQ